MPATSPPVIYRYLPLRPDAVDLIRNGRLWFSNPARFNDPFDFLPDFSKRAKEAVFMEGTKKDRDRRVREFCEKMRGRFLKDLGRTFCLACFCELPDSILMWSHYAANHTGLCIGIRPDKMRLPPEKALRWKVHYDDERLPFEHPKPNELPLRKALAWEYENEWRVVMEINDLTLGRRPLPRPSKRPLRRKRPRAPEPFLRLQWDAFESVRLGALVNPKKRSEVLKILQRAEQRHIEVFQMYLAADRFKLEEERFPSRS